MTPHKRIWTMVALTLLAAAFRFWLLDAVPLRGDEAFSVRFWAQAPAEAWQLSATEPHPIGTFLLFWAWKSLAGDSELAMRTLPALVNLLGVAVMLVLGRRLLHKSQWVWLLGLLWAVNPFQIWHAQDVRNYALWSAVSPLALWLFLLAVERNRPRDWGLYGVAALVSCHLFLLEPFFLLVHGITLLIFYRDRLRPALLTWLAVGIGWLPIAIQLYRLAGSDYQATATAVSLATLARDFLPTLLLGETSVNLSAGIGLLLILAVGLLLVGRQRQTQVLLGLWLFLPILLLMLVGTQMDIFRPRYIIPVTPALLLSLLYLSYQRRLLNNLTLSLVLVGLSLGAVYGYFYSDPPKAPDWRNFAAYVESRATADDLVILNSADPAFGYYYNGVAGDIPADAITDAENLFTDFRGVYIQTGMQTADISQALQDSAQFIPPATALVKQYRAYAVDPAEIQFPLAVTVGDVAILRGYSVLGDDAWGVTLLLYWEPLRQTATEYVGFVHVPAPNGVGLIAQDDHAPLFGDAPTTAWNPGDLLRDPFVLNLPAGTHQLVVGMYENGSLTRLPLTDSDGTVHPEAYPLATIGG